MVGVEVSQVSESRPGAPRYFGRAQNQRLPHRKTGIIIVEAPHNMNISPFNKTNKMRSPGCALKLAANKMKASHIAKSGKTTIMKNEIP
jgi:hypothetical protein